MAEGINQEKAKVLFDEGATLIFLDVPLNTEFGIDYNSWQVGPKFKGVKMIPPGIHFVYYSARSKENECAPRTGFFYNFKSREIVVKRWDPTTEDIKVETVSEEELQKFADTKKDMDRFLGAYPYENFKKWVSLSSHITPALLHSLQPTSGTICSVSSFVSEPTNTAQRQAAAATAMETATTSDGEDPADMLPDMKRVPGSEIRFTEVPKQKYPPGATPEEVTKYSMDYSYTLETILSKYSSKDDVLGELQFAFMCFIVGQVYEGFEQWKVLVNLLCNCCEALRTHGGIFKQFMTVLHFQLKEVPSDFFVDIVSQDNFLTATLHSFFENLESGDADEDLKLRGRKFSDHLTKSFRWDFTGEPDEYAPVVVPE